MGLNESLADGKSDASAARTLLATTPRTIESFEHMGQFVGGDARPIVRNGDINCIVPLLSSDAHFARTIRLRISDQIMEYNLYSCAVYVDQRQVVGDVQRYCDSLGTQVFDGFRYEVLHPDWRALEKE